MPRPARIGYVLKRYPRHSETFVVNEVLAHEAAGQPIDIVDLRSMAETHFQDILGRVRALVTYVPHSFRDGDAFWALLRAAGDGLLGAWRSLEMLDGSNGHDVAQPIHVARACRERGIGPLHAHFGTVATSVARLVAALAGISYSFTADAKDIFYEYDESQDIEIKLLDAARAVTVSDLNLAYLRDHYDAVQSLVRIYNGIDLDRFLTRRRAPMPATSSRWAGSSERRAFTSSSRRSASGARRGGPSGAASSAAARRRQTSSRRSPRAALGMRSSS